MSLEVQHVPSISAEDLYESIKRDDLVLLDVREPEEFSYTKIDCSILVPLGDLEEKLDQLALKYLSSNIVVICRSGQRSEIATNLLLEFGFKNIRNLEGGLLNYANFDQRITRY